MKINKPITILLLVLIAAAIITTVNISAKTKDSEGKVKYLFVQTADAVTFKGDRMTLQDVSPATLYFSDRPERITGHGLTEEFVDIWSQGKNSFANDPPNATVSFLEDKKMKDAVVVLMEPELNDGDLTYRIKVLEGDIPNSAGAVSVFIDIIGRPLTPFSYAGAARRFRRGALMY